MDVYFSNIFQSSNHCHALPPGAVVGLEKTYQVSEDVGVVEVCAIVYTPSVDCPITIPFNVLLSTKGGPGTNRAGMKMQFKMLMAYMRKLYNYTVYTF